MKIFINYQFTLILLWVNCIIVLNAFLIWFLKCSFQVLGGTVWDSTLLYIHIDLTCLISIRSLTGNQLTTSTTLSTLLSVSWAYLGFSTQRVSTVTKSRLVDLTILLLNRFKQDFWCVIFWRAIFFYTLYDLLHFL